MQTSETETEDLVVRQSVDVPLPPDEAFDLFTEDLGTWWPMKKYSVSAGGASGRGQVRVTPGVGNRITETLPSGGEADWATIRVWKPGVRLGLAWYPGNTEDEATDVDVRFEPIPSGTRVTVVHTGFARCGAEATAIAGRYRAGWSEIFRTCFAPACVAAHSVPAA